MAGIFHRSLIFSTGTFCGALVITAFAADYASTDFQTRNPDIPPLEMIEIMTDLALPFFLKGYFFCLLGWGAIEILKFFA